MAGILAAGRDHGFSPNPPPSEGRQGGGWLDQRPPSGSPSSLLRRSALGSLLAGLLVLAACTGGEPSTETREAAERPDAEALEDQETVVEREPGSEGAQPSTGQRPPERGQQEPRPAEGAEPAGGGAQPEPGAAEGAQPPAPQQGQTAAEGVIAVTGTDIDARPVLQTADGALGITGDLTAELRRLSGARVRVEGERRSGRLPSESIDVSSYTVLEVNGERPEVGTIMLRDGTPWLAGDDTVRLIGASDRLTGLDAAKVWVTGRRTDEGFEVGSYGVIRR